jgi:NADPH:quinone reductase-like Zn-dependent oxidoreductase
MRAIIRDTYGPPESLRLGDLPEPTPAAGEVTVRVHAASLFAGDQYVLRGRPLMVRAMSGLRRPSSPVPGRDLAGTVVAVGADVSDLAPGDAVLGWTAGSLAELVRVPVTQLVKKPATITFEEAAAVPEAALTALQAVRDAGRVQPGNTVLVIGASGGVGTYAVQIAAALGAEVTAAVSTRNLELVRSIGAAHTVDYTTTDPATTGPYDVIVQVAGTASANHLRRALTRTGTLVLSSGQGRLNGVGRMLVAALLNPFVPQRLAVLATKENRTDLQAIVDMLADGRIRSVIDTTYPLAEAVAAFRHLETGHTRGKLVLTI